MSQPKIALITPSYAPDFERCKLLSETINLHNRSESKHYIVIDKKDFALFNQLKGANTVIIPKEELLPNWLVKIPFFTKKNIWFNWKGFPVRGWLIQQLIKLAIADYIEEEVLVFVDSDVFFLRDFDLNRFIKEDKVRFFAQPERVNTNNPHLPRWYYDASHLLGIEKPQFPVSNYMGQLIFWRKDNVIKLHRHLEQQNHKPWIEAICANWNVSEYILYGVFVEKILKDRSGHYMDNCDLCHNYWEEESLHTNELSNFFANIKPESIAAMLSAKADIPVANYSHLAQSF